MPDEDSTTPKLDGLRLPINSYQALVESIAVIDGVVDTEASKAIAIGTGDSPAPDPDAIVISPYDGTYALAAVIIRCIKGLITAGAIEGDTDAIWNEEDPPVEEA